MNRMAAPSPDRSYLDELIRRSMEEFNRLTPAEQRAHYAKQRQSWARAFGPCKHGVLDWEQCQECRRTALGDG